MFLSCELIILTVWNLRGLLEGAKPKSTRQQEKAAFIISLLSSDHSGSTDRMTPFTLLWCCPVPAYWKYLTNKQWNPPISALLTCKCWWALSSTSYIPTQKFTWVNYLQLLLSPILWSICLYIEACVILHCVHQCKSQTTYSFKTLKSQPQERVKC